MSNREQVMTNIETLVKTAASVKFTTRNVMPLENLPNNVFPAVQIIDSGDIGVLHKTGGVATVSIDCKIRIITQAEYKNNATSLNVAEQQILAALFSDIKLGGSVDLVEIMERDAEELESTYPYVVITRNVVIHYTGNVNTGL